MTLHFVHIGKTGGTAVKRGLRRAGFAYWRPELAEQEANETPFGRIRLHHHGFHLADVPPGDFVFFSVRDPLARFVSAFYSRLNKGQPRYYREWSDAERVAFERFPTAQRLGGALASGDHEERALAERAMRGIQHLRGTTIALGGRREIWARRRQIVYIARQETLPADWEQLKALLGIPVEAQLPSDAKAAHRRDPSLDTHLDATAVAALRRWYRHEYRLVDYCERMRAWHGWGAGPAPARGFSRLRRDSARLRGLPAILPPPPAAIQERLRPR